ncbi:MAG TPA: hypothetical protein VFT09_05015 [Ilumatobacteraceae bacterium]|nr:hypothetical protein [Ilumatobacteraceae bacterium]
MTATGFIPTGYGVPAGGGEQGMRDLMSLRQLLATTTVARGHPEFRRRVIAAILLAHLEGVAAGIGTMWRSYAQQAALHARNPAGSAPAGRSNHEGNNEFDDRDAIAVDIVPSSAQRWLADRPELLRRCGLICFRPSADPRYWNEPEHRPYAGRREDWHLQPVEVRYARGGRRTRAVLRAWPVPGHVDIDTLDLDDPFGRSLQPPPEPPQPPPPLPEQTNPPVDPVGQLAQWTGYATGRLTESPPGMPAHSLEVGSTGAEVVLLQLVLQRWHAEDGRIPHPGGADGHYGPQTAAALTALQQLHLQPDAGTPDGAYGPRTHLSLQVLSDNLYAMAHTPTPTTPAEWVAAADARLMRNEMPAHVLERGAEGPEVYLLQLVLERFAAHGQIRGPGSPDGRFGAVTEASLLDMQAVYLQPGAGNPDGSYGPRSHLTLQVLADTLAGMAA